MTEYGDDIFDLEDNEKKSLKNGKISDINEGEKLYNYEDIDYIKKDDKNKKEENIDDLISNEDIEDIKKNVDIEDNKFDHENINEDNQKESDNYLKYEEIEEEDNNKDIYANDYKKENEVKKVDKEIEVKPKDFKNNLLYESDDFHFNNNDLNKNEENNKENSYEGNYEEFNEDINNKKDEEKLNDEEINKEENNEDKISENKLNNEIKREEIEEEKKDEIINPQNNKKITLSEKIKKQNHDNNKLRISAKKRTYISNFDTAEKLYNEIKPQITEVVSKNNDNLIEFNKDNNKMLNLINQLNNIVSIMAKNFKIQNKKNKKNSNEEKVDLGKNNDQIINQYKIEFDRLDQKIQQLNQPNYNEELEDKKKDILRNLQFYDKEIKSLQKQQKMNEIILIKEIKNFDKRKIKVSRVDTDYNTLRNNYEKLCDQREKNEQRKRDNEAKLKELKEFKIKLEEMGKEMYDIKEFKDISDINKSSLDKINKQKILEKNLNIIEAAFTIHKKQYEKEIALKEKTVFEKEKEKLKLLREMRMETVRNEKLLNKIKELYEPIQKMQYEEEEKNKLNNHNSEIIEALINKEKEKEKLIKETNLINEELNISPEKKKEIKSEKKIENILNKKEKKDENKEDELIESKSNFSRKPNLDFGKQTLNTNNINNNDFSHLLTNNEKEKENQKEEEKEPLDEPIADDEERKELNYNEPIDINKETENEYLENEEIEDKKFNDDDYNKNNNKVINNEENYNEENNNNVLDEDLIKERDDEFIKNMKKNINMKKDENNFNDEEQMINDEEREIQFNELLKEVKPKRGTDINPVDVNQFNDIL